MRLFFSLLGLLGLAAAHAQPGEAAGEASDPLAGAPAPLAAAVRAFAAESGRWAYTQHVVTHDRKGHLEEERLVRHDPSQHYDVQWTLLRQDGQEPTEGQQKKFRREMAKQQKKRKTLGELLTWSQAVLTAETPDALTYEVPLRQDDDQRFPPEKFQVFVVLDRTGPAPALQHIDLKLRASLRVAGVVKVKSGEGRIEFTRVLPERGPAVSRVALAGAASVLFVPVGGRTEVTRTDLRRVTPYDERFQVRIEPLKTLDF